MEEFNIENIEEFLDDETTCSICFAEFLDANDLRQHITQIHLDEVTLNKFCYICNRLFQDVEGYALHLRTYHLKSLRWCKFCTRVFFNKEDLKTHEKKHGEWKYKSCSHCDKSFLFTDILAAHEYNEHRNYKDFSEGVMLQDCFPVLSGLLHMNVKKFFTVQYTHESYKCISCGLATSDIDKFLRHIETESKKPFVCNKCCRVFSHKYKLRLHVNKNCSNNEEWSECSVCEKRIKRIALQTHRQKCVPKIYDADTEATKLIPILNCKFCRKMFVGNVALDKHIDRIHKPNFHLYKYKCTTCDIPFHHPKYLFAHYFTNHKDMHPFTCKICNKTYRMRKSFTLHIKLDHKSVGFVEFDEDYKVFFTDKKSENPFQPYIVIPEYFVRKQVNGNKKVENKNNDLNLDNSDFINATETECEIGVNRRENNLLKPATILEDETECETDVETGEKNLLKPAEIIDDETECETDTERREKPAVFMKDQKEGETDIDQKTKNLLVKHSGYADIEIDCSTNLGEKSKANLKRRRSVKDESETDVDTAKKRVTSKRKSTLKNKNKQNYNSEVSSNDSDVPLIEMAKRDMVAFRRKRKKNKFVCLKCNKNCYTYQNYNHHMSLHVGCKLKKCIKCQKTFKSRLALDEHMKKKHASSKLTDTLKQVLERRKNGVQASTPDPLTLRENLKKTIHKVIIPEDESVPAVLKLLDDGISAKSFIESFMPEDSSKDIKIINSVTIKETKGGNRPTIIKMTKFKPESPTTTTKLRMPVKFKSEKMSHEKAKIKVIHKAISTYHKPQLALNLVPEENDNTHQSYNSDNAYDRDEVPDVAQEVMLNTEEKEDIKQPRVVTAQNSIVIPNIHENYGDIKIAHLQEEAPFYRIVSMKDVMKSAPTTFQPSATSLTPVTLPGGMKLVTVNPLAHLLGKTEVEKILKPNKHYVSKVRDIKSAMEKAMKNVYQPKRRRKIS